MDGDDDVVVVVVVVVDCRSFRCCWKRKFLPQQRRGLEAAVPSRVVVLLHREAVVVEERSEMVTVVGCVRESLS